MTAAAARAAERSPCPGLVFRGSADVRLTDVERRLVCGDEGTPGWKVVPRNQAEYLVRAFLQQRGYQDPRFTAESGRLVVDPGPRSRVGRVVVRGLPDGTDASKLRGLRGRDLTPAELDRLKLAVSSLLQDSGYPCADVQPSADAESGDVSISVVPGPRRTLDGIAPARTAGVDPRVFDRYEAFRRGQMFDMRLLDLTARRTLADSLFVSAFYEVSCSSAGESSIVQRVSAGKPQLYRLGIGFDTEGYLIGKAQWQNSRLGRGKSTLEGSVYASFLQETAEGSVHYYASPASRLYLMPRAVFDREDQIQFQYVKSEASLQPGTSWDGESARLEAVAGPALDHVTTVRGVGPPNDTFLAFKTRWSAVDHLYEYYATEPRRGWRGALETVSRVVGAESELTAHRLTVQGEGLWNLGRYDPPAVILGARFWAGTTYVNDPARARRDLGPDMRFFLGGNANLRGAPLNSLPSDDAGFMTVLYDGLELRLADVLAYGLQPLAFVDAAMGGRTDLHLDPDVYWSPGFGLRWRLPVGSIRATAARGQLWRRDVVQAPLYSPRWQYFFSFGEEF